MFLLKIINHSSARSTSGLFYSDKTEYSNSETKEAFASTHNSSPNNEK